jgi:hypothetical protein
MDAPAEFCLQRRNNNFYAIEKKYLALLPINT